MHARPFPSPPPSLLPGRWGGRLATEMEMEAVREGGGREGNSDYGYFSWDTRPPSPPRPREPLLLMDHISEFP